MTNYSNKVTAWVGWGGVLIVSHDHTFPMSFRVKQTTALKGIAIVKELTMLHQANHVRIFVKFIIYEYLEADERLAFLCVNSRSHATLE